MLESDMDSEDTMLRPKANQADTREPVRYLLHSHKVTEYAIDLHVILLIKSIEYAHFNIFTL